jgi:alpha-L-fucosidase
MKSKQIIYLVALSFLLQLSFQAVKAQYEIPEKMKWWYQDRFGMFIHFGSYSYAGRGEWVLHTEGWEKADYQTQISTNFNPTDFNAGTIARLAKKAGMKYLVITAKHHEGFCMWDTHVASFKDVTGTKDYDLPGFTAFNTRDVLQELKDSCDAVGIKFCLYYSILDWCHSSQTVAPWWSTMASMEARADYIDDMKAQLSELVTKYHPYVMWFDGDWDGNTGDPTLEKWWTKNDGIDLYDFLIELDSNLIVNERVFRNAGLGDFMCPEKEVPDSPEERPWETCQTMNNSWGYNASDLNYKSASALIQQLIQVVSRDGNYLLNIGPKGDGTVPEETVTLLNAMGDWMDVYGESIYRATRSPYVLEPDWGLFTKKEGKLYAHMFSWPTTGTIEIPELENDINSIYLLNDPTTLLEYTVSLNSIEVKLPATAPNEHSSVIVVEVDSVPEAVPFDPSKFKTYTFEAEDYVTSTEGTDFDIKESRYASYGKYISVKSGTEAIDAPPAGPEGLITINFNIEEASNYYIYFRINCVNGDDDSFWLKVDNDGFSMFNNLVTTSWEWKNLMSISLAEGEHTLTIGYREDGAKLDMLCISNYSGIPEVEIMPKPTNIVIPNTDLKLLGDCYPNPVKQTTRIPFFVNENTYVSLKVYNTQGAEVAELAGKYYSKGIHEIEFHTQNIPNGVYLYRINTGKHLASGKMVVE